jgi:transglutaminase superfamily protein
MALLLRMGGVPARVATGFAPGSYDRSRKEYVVRDIDAHSWVEAWFPGIGWTTFDPTPAVAPARTGPSFGVATANVGERVTRRRRPLPASAAARARAPHGGAGAWWLWVAGAMLLGTCAGGVVLARRSGGRPATAVAELERALRRCGRRPAPELTLRQLERRLRGAPDAAAYVRAVREAHYGYGTPATRAQRRALRHELARGLGVGGRVRAWWALPPRRG